MNSEQDQAILTLSALGHDARLSVYRLLMRAGDEGMSVGEIAANLNIPASTLAHHLSHLVQAKLIIQTKKSRTIFNRVNFDRMRLLVDFLTRECCTGVDEKSNAA